MRLHRMSNPADAMEDLPGVTILKPLMGVDSFLESNLESHFNLQYPKVYCSISEGIVPNIQRYCAHSPKVSCQIS